MFQLFIFAIFYNNYKIFYILWINILEKLFFLIYQKWIIRKRDDGRYIVRTPKIGVLIREQDFGKETLLPKNSKPRE